MSAELKTIKEILAPLYSLGLYEANNQYVVMWDDVMTFLPIQRSQFTDLGLAMRFFETKQVELENIRNVSN